MAGSKRGAHLALSLERLEEIAHEPPQRIGLSATQRPLEEIARFLGGQTASGPRPVTIVDAGLRKPMEVEVVVPVEDMAELSDVAETPQRMPLMLGPATPGTAPPRASIWPAIHPEVLELIRAHRSTIVFVNARRLAERLAARLNELAGEELARAHHGSIAREQRLEIEDRLKRGTLKAIVATSSLELGIDMGAVDLVIQVESPGSVARGIAADRPRRPPGRRAEPRQGVPEVPRRPARGDRGRAADAAGRDRGDALPAEPARRARAADRRDVRDGRVERRGSGSRAPTGGELRRAVGRPPAERPGPARRPVPLGRVRRAPATDRVGPADRHAPRARGRRPTGDRLGRHDPRPRAVRRVHGRRAARGRARRGDGVREPSRRGVHARRVVVADRGHHARPRGGLAGAGRAGEDAVLARRQARAAARARAGDRRSHPRALLVGARPGRAAATDGVRPGRARRREPHGVPRGPTRGDRRGPRRPHDRGRTLPRRDRRLARVRAIAVRRAGARALGDGDRGQARRTVRARRPGAVERRRHRDPPARVRGADPGRGPAVRPRRDRGPGRRSAPGHRAVHDHVPRGRRPSAAAPPPDAGPTDPAVAAAAARRRPAGGRLASPHVPDPARGHARGPAGRVRRAGAQRRAGRHPSPARPDRSGGHDAVVAVRAIAVVPLDLGLHVRGRRADGRTARHRALARPRAPARAARLRGPPRADRSDRARRARARAAASHRGPPRAQPRRRARPAAAARRPERGGSRGARERRPVGLARRPRTRRARDPPPGRGAGPVRRGRGRGALPGRARRVAAARRADGVHRAHPRAARRTRGPPRADARAIRDRRRRREARRG